MPPLPGPRPETSELRVLTRTEVTDGVVLAVTVEILQTSRPTDELPPPCPVAERAARGVGNRSTRSREIELSEIARDRADSGGQGGKRRSAQQPRPRLRSKASVKRSERRSGPGMKRRLRPPRHSARPPRNGLVRPRSRADRRWLKQRRRKCRPRRPRRQSRRR